MPGAVRKILPVAALGDVTARGVVHLPALYGASGLYRVLNKTHCPVARLADDVENLLDPLGRLRSRKSDPGNIIIHRVGPVLLGPHVEQDEVARLDLRAGS